MKTLTVSNVAQRALFELELQGQLSDGHWENTRPLRHWHDWCECKVVVQPGMVGVNFYPVKDTYNFTAPALLECVGDRMLRNARRAIAFGFERAQALHELEDLDGRIEMPDTSYTGDYWDKKRADVAALGDELAEVQRVSEDAKLYSARQMRQDLRALKLIIKTQSPKPMNPTQPTKPPFSHEFAAAL
jgi:hypothetical protein